MTSPRLRRLCAAVAATTLLLSACGDDEPAPEQTGAAEAEGLTEGAAAASGEGDEAGGGGEDLGAEFEELAASAADTRARVTYEVTTDGETATATVSFDPPRMATIFDGGRLINGEDESIMCSEDEAAGSECYVLGEDEAPLGNMMSSWLLWPFMTITQTMANGGGAEGFSRTVEETIAGREAICASFDGGALEEPQEGLTAEYCIDGETGIGLRYIGRAPDTEDVRMEAIDYGEPRADDFEPTAEPRPLDDAPAE